jgi:uncharacterized membrane protein
MKCPKCNFEVTTKVNFCPYCGHDLSKPYEHEEVIDAEIKEEKVEDEVKETNTSTSYDYSDNMYDMKDIEENKVFALFSYLGFLFIIPLIAKPDSRYCKFHVNQGIILCIVNAIVSAISSILLKINVLPISYITSVFDLIMLAYTVYGIYNAVTGNAKELPLIGKYRILK